MVSNKVNIRELELGELENDILNLGEKKFRAKQIWHWIYHHGETNINKMTTISTELRKEISKKFKCDPDKIICGSGSDEVIQMICQLFLKPKDEVIVPEYSFLMYRIYANIVDAKVKFAKEIDGL